MRPESLVDPASLRAARISAGLTQHQLARRIGVAGGERVSRWERGASVPRPEILLRIAKACGVGAVSLLVPVAGDHDLRRLRLLAGVSAPEVAQVAHVSLATYVRWEAGETDRLPTDATLAALGSVLGVTSAQVAAGLQAAQRGGA